MALAYVNQDADKRKHDRERKAKARISARKLGVVDDFDIAALDQAAMERRTRIFLATLHPTPPRKLLAVPQESLEDMVEVWLGREVLRLRKIKPNAPNIARWIAETGRRNRGKNHAALSTRVDKDLRRIGVFERVPWEGGTLLPTLDAMQELPAIAPDDAEV